MSEAVTFQALAQESFDLPPACGTIGFVRWLIASVLSFAIVGPATAGVFKARGGSKPAAAAPAKKDKPAAAPAAAAPAKKAPAKTAAVKKAPAKKSAVAASGRPDDLTPETEPPAKKKKGAKDAVTITEEDGDDVIIRDIDD